MPSLEHCRSFFDLGQIMVYVGLMTGYTPEGAQEPVASSFLAAMGADVGTGVIEI